MRKLALILIVVLPLTAMLWAVGLQPQPLVYAQNTDCYRSVGGNKWVCDNGGEMEFQTGATLDVQSGATFAVAANIVQSDGNTTVADLFTLGAQTGITVTNGQAFAPTGSYQPISSSGTVTPTITAAAAGTVVHLVNTTNTSIVIVDTGTAKLASNITMGQYDSLTIMSDGTNWIELARSNN